jgi:glycosyltransferase involved in cell wall biosynthesis
MSGQFTRSMATVTFDEGQEYLGVFPKDRIVFNRAVSDWCLRSATRCFERQAIEDALQWDLLAAKVMSFECATLVSTELEKQLLHIGRGLKAPDTEMPSQSQSNRWLHVLTEVYPDGGHSAMLRRWVEQDPKHNRHSIVLLAQAVPVPESLVDSLKLRKGDLFRMDPRDTLLARITRLREIVRTQADVVVLHTHPWDVIATVALSNSGGPPVLLVNHAAHIFWVGASVADVILNCRNSPQEDEWTARCRGNKRIMHLPIPLNEPGQRENRSGHDFELREIARSSLKLPTDALVMLTVGIDNKYTPLPGVDFLQAAGAVLKAQPKAYLIAVGPKFDARWMELREDVGERLIFVEKQPATSMATFFDAADIYLEGFPFGSTTSMFEAGLRGIACVLTPKMCPPPFTTDGIALQMMIQSDDISDYVKCIHALLDDKEERQRIGQLLAKSIRLHHCGKGWARYLEEVQNNVPTVHEVRMLNSSLNVPEDLSAYWTAFSFAVNEDPLAFAFQSAIDQGLKPTVDLNLLRQLYRSGRRGRGRHYPSGLSMFVHASKRYLPAFLKPAYILLKSILQSVTNMTERAKIICQTGK